MFFNPVNREEALKSFDRGKLKINMKRGVFYSILVPYGVEYTECLLIDGKIKPTGQIGYRSYPVGKNHPKYVTGLVERI